MKRREIKKKQKRKGKEKKIGIINDMQVKKKDNFKRKFDENEI